MYWHVADLLHGACADMLLGRVAALLLTCLPAGAVCGCVAAEAEAVLNQRARATKASGRRQD